MRTRFTFLPFLITASFACQATAPEATAPESSQGAAGAWRLGTSEPDHQQCELERGDLERFVRRRCGNAC